MTTSALSTELKHKIQEGYRAWLKARQFRARRGQREMIAHIARTLTGDARRIIAIEAGTGTGKTAAYCLAAVPIAQALGKTIVISSATVALQEQVVLRDLPDLKKNTGFQFDFALAKGRGRYLCLKRLDDRLKYSGQQEIPLFDTLSEDSTALYHSMLVAFGVLICSNSSHSTVAAMLCAELSSASSLTRGSVSGHRRPVSARSKLAA